MDDVVFEFSTDDEDGAEEVEEAERVVRDEDLSCPIKRRGLLTRLLDGGEGPRDETVHERCGRGAAC